MGFSDVTTNHLDLNMPQTPVNVMTVRVNAGWNCNEVAKELGINPERFKQAENGFRRLPDSVWRNFLELCGRRAFDSESGE